MKMKVLISAFSFALALDDANHNSTDMENSKIFQAIEMDNGRYSNYRNSLDRKYARSQERISGAGSVFLVKRGFILG